MSITPSRVSHRPDAIRLLDGSLLPSSRTFESAPWRERNLRRRLGEFVVRRRTEIALVGIAVGAGVLAVSMAVKGALDVNFVGTIKETIRALAGVPTGQEPVIASSFETDMTIGAPAAAVSGLASLAHLAHQQDKRERSATSRGDLGALFSGEDNDSPLHQIRAEILARDRRRQRQLALGQEIADHYGGAPVPTTQTYFAHNYHVPAGQFSSDLRLWDEDLNDFIANSNGPTVRLASTHIIDYEGDAPLVRV